MGLCFWRSTIKLEIEKFSLKMEKLGKNISKLLNFVLILIFHDKKLKWAYENIWCLWWFLLSFLSLLSQQKSVHCRVVATKFYKTKILSLEASKQMFLDLCQNSSLKIRRRCWGCLMDSCYTMSVHCWGHSHTVFIRP